ncbi:MAG: hypothetical protein Q8930_12120 [Bacillota bacterium]|nr:hypothetical protein [Bacillota bacterium]
MAQKKSYSRYFIILQQDENGYSLSSDKLPSGYTKLETKNDKCKISYYVQNLKKDMEPYHMVLICSKKDVKRLIRLGVMNIDEHGRSEVTYEYNSSNIAGSGIGIDMITGAAVVKDGEPDLISVMSGFASADTPADWRTYEMFEYSKASAEDDNKTVEEKKALEEKIAEVIEAVEAKAPVVEAVEENRESQGTIFEEYEEKIEEIKNSKPVEEIKSSGPVEEESAKEPEKQVEVEAIREEVLQPAAYIQAEPEIPVTEEKIQETSMPVEAAEEHKVEEKVKPASEEIRKEEQKPASKSSIDHEIEYPTGTVGEFFKLVAEDFEEIKEACREIKRCRWYKVNVNNLEDMCNVSNYNRYTIVYYPMVSYFPYIKRHGHFMLGYKYDPSGKMKYIVYAIPGSKNLNDQPYGGKSGFVTWVSEKEGEERDGDAGYWLMFYDFRTSTIVIPVK